MYFNNSRFSFVSAVTIVNFVNQGQMTCILYLNFTLALHNKQAVKFGIGTFVLEFVS